MSQRTERNVEAKASHNGRYLPRSWQLLLAYRSVKVGMVGQSASAFNQPLHLIGMDIIDNKTLFGQI